MCRTGKIIFVCGIICFLLSFVMPMFVSGATTWGAPMSGTQVAVMFSVMGVAVLILGMAVFVQWRFARLAGQSQPVDRNCSLDGKMLKRTKVGAAIMVIIVIGFCVWPEWQGGSLRIRWLVSRHQLPDDIVLTKIANIIWTTNLQEVHAEKTIDGGIVVNVTIKYGDRRAQGDLNSERERRTRILAEGALRMYQTGHARHLEKLVMNLETDVEFITSYHTFDVYKASLTMGQLEKLPQWLTRSVNDESVGLIRTVWVVEEDNFDKLKVFPE
jgi:hypothetical protein